MQQDAKKIRDAAFDALRAGDQQGILIYIAKVLSINPANLDDLYLSGELALDAGLYNEALEMLGLTIKASLAEEDTWYLDSAHILRAYTRIQLGEYPLAEEDLDKIDDEIAITWLKNHPVITKQSLLDLIAQHND